MTRLLSTLVPLIALAACSGGSDTDPDGDGGVVGDGTSPVVDSAAYACFVDPNEQVFFYFRITGRDQQGADTLGNDAARLYFIDPSTDEPLDFNQDGSPDEEAYLILVCEPDTDPRICNGSLLEGAITGACDGTPLEFEGWLIDEDGNESERTRDFTLDASILPSG